MSKYVYKRIFVKDEHNMEVVIPYRCLSKEVKKLFRLKDVNLIEHGYCANLETYNGYHWDKETDRYTQITGSNWKMIPKDMFIKIKEA